MQIQKYSLGQLQANCYFIVEDKKCVIIDPADEAEFILEKIQRENLEPLMLLATHGHFDHVMAAGEIQLSFNIPLYIHESDFFLIKRLSQTAEHFLEYQPTIIFPQDIKFFTKNSKFKIGKSELEIMSTPGHTPGSCCYYLKEMETLFTGDTLFKDSIGSYDHAYSSYEDLKKSLKMIKQFSEETMIYPGHGKNGRLLDTMLYSDYGHLVGFEDVSQ